MLQTAKRVVGDGVSDCSEKAEVVMKIVPATEQKLKLVKTQNKPLTIFNDHK